MSIEIIGQEKAMSVPKVVGISGNFTRPSRTRSLVELIAAQTAHELGATSECFDLVDAGSRLGATFSRADAAPEHENVWKAVEACSVLVVGSPVYKASYTGLLKHFFDLFDMNALKARPVIVAATGRAPQHALMIEHQMRPLFGFFSAHPVPTGIYVTEADYSAEGLTESMSKRVAAAATEAARAWRSLPA
jgi:FMN reductase